jgi:cold shock CspA family protein
MPTGKVLRWQDEKGFGFIAPDDGGDDLFCHVSGLLGGEGSVRQGDTVSFRITYDDRKGKDRATDVEVAGGGGGGGGRRGRSRSRSRGGGGYSRGGGGDRHGKGGGGKGDSRPGDWTCPDCGANVFASKDSCFKCGGRKSGGGGRGGGRDDYDRRR